jgi:response regulator RpfG family c-di-GMP phosphodiesterase
MAYSLPAQLAEQLLAERVITAEQYEAVTHKAKTEGTRIEDVLIDSGFVSEADLLKYLAKQYKTRFVLTSKLARVDLDRALLELLPRKVAEAQMAVPVLFDPATSTLSVVSPDAGNPAVVRAVQEATGVRDVRVFVGRPAGVRAAIHKYYGGDIYAFARTDSSGREQYMSLLELYDRGTLQLAPTPQGVTGLERGRDRMLTEHDLAPRTAAPPPAAATSLAIELSTVFVNLLEQGRGDLRGHSGLVARWLRKLGERIRLDAPERDALALAGQLHDVSKTSTYHLTALNVAQFESHRTVAQKAHGAPAQLFESVHVAPAALEAITHMYERFDGGGFPAGLAGKDIPLGARLLAVVDTWADLTHNRRNPYRRLLTVTEACDVLDRQRGSVFDPNLVDLLRQAVTHDDLRERLRGDGFAVLVVEPDPEESAVLELKLLEAGFEVHAVRTAEEALATLSRGAIDVCVSEVELPNTTGLDLLAHVRASPAPWADVPWVFLTRDGRRDTIARAFEAGATDYINRPAPPEVLTAKLRQIVQQRSARQARGVSGSLAELALPDVVQVLHQGRKTGQLRIRAGADAGEVHFVEGSIVNALWPGLRGEEAFYAMLTLADGEFVFDPSFKPAARVITASAEALVLEGMRRLDERSSAR